MFWLIGLGLGDIKDITVKGLEKVKECEKIFLEAYTSILSHGPAKEELESFYGKSVILADREMIEQQSDELLSGAKDKDVALLVVGDPFGATTHADLVMRAKELGIEVGVIHNASIMNAVGCTGLQLYNFGETVSIVFWTDTWQPDSYYERITANRKRGLHTLCLLDIKVKEQTVENMMKGKNIFEPPRYMSASEAAEQLLEISRRKTSEEDPPAFDGETQCVALARVGWADQKIVSCTLEEMKTVDMGDPLHSLIIVGQPHYLEAEMLKLWSLNKL